MDGIGGLFQALANAIVGLFGGIFEAFGQAIRGMFAIFQAVLPGPWLVVVGAVVVVFFFWQFVKR
jgi:hypothetical protein